MLPRAKKPMCLLSLQLRRQKLRTLHATTPAVSPTERIAPSASPIATFRASPTDTIVPTITLAPTDSPTPPPTVLPLLYSALIPTPTPMPVSDDQLADSCEVAGDWLDYAVQEGDSLLTIAYRIGSTIIDLRDGNCFGALRGVFAGETILLPTLPERPQATAVPVLPDDQVEVSPPICNGTGATIVSPQPGQELYGVFTLLASDENALEGAYVVEVRPAWSDTFWEYRRLTPRPPDQLLTLLNTELFGSGLHWLRVKQLDENHETIAHSTCDIPTMFLES